MENHIRKNRRIIVGISGASGVILGYEMLKALREQDSTEIHLIVTEGAKRSLSLESKMTVDSLFSLADAVYHETEGPCCKRFLPYRRNDCHSMQYENTFRHRNRL